MIAHLAEVERRRLYLAEACSSMYTFCIERMGYSENEAHTRLQVARLCSQFPGALEALESGSIHLTGLALLCPKVTEANAQELLDEARGKTRREIEALLARRFPRPDVLPSITPLQPTLLEKGNPGLVTQSEQVAQSAGSTVPRSRVEPLSAASFRVEFTASADLRQKLELAQNLLSHAVSTGDLAALVERAIDELLAAELKRRMGAERPRARRSLGEGSRHVPVDVSRAVWERDGFQCTFVDEHGHRCSEKRYITLEHQQPFARGGPPTVDNLALLCKAHNAHRAREVFGDAYIAKKQAEDRACSKVLSALTNLGFRSKQAKQAIARVRNDGVDLDVEPLLRAALAVLA
ncbi:MAG: hypothetical protein IT375_20645 [Polyangiaceae bacterium]|nr:hypothetical protein [Polyangiaceae bacterium]